jgi:hypothetical protein
MLSPDGPEEALCHVLRGPKFRGQVIPLSARSESNLFDASRKCCALAMAAPQTQWDIRTSQV